MISRKISSKLAQTVSTSSGERKVERRIIFWTAHPVHSNRPLSPTEAISALESIGFKPSFFDNYDIRIRHVFTLVNAFSAELPQTSIARLAKEVDKYPEVLFVDEAGVYRTTLDHTVRMIKVDTVWRDYGYTGKGVKIAVVDSGVDESHPDLKGRVIAKVNFTLPSLPPPLDDLAPILDLFGEPDPDYKDYNGHGTHVAGIAAGAGDKYRGVAPEAYIINAKALNKLGRGSEDDIAAAIEWSYYQGASIINLSLGGVDYSLCRDTTAIACEEVAKRGVIVVAAAGNEGPKSGTIASPGCSSLVITVGAVTKNGQLASYSSRGPTKDLQGEKPDILAPGGDSDNPVIAPLSQSISPERLQELRSETVIVDDLYIGLCGTSMATPHVAGVAALLLEEAKELGVLEWGGNPNYLVKHVLVSTATNLGYSKYEQGAGLINAAAAIEYLRKMAEMRKVAKKTTENGKIIIETKDKNLEKQKIEGGLQQDIKLPPIKIDKFADDIISELARSLGFSIAQIMYQREDTNELKLKVQELDSQLKGLKILRNLNLISEAEYQVQARIIQQQLLQIVNTLNLIRILNVFKGSNSLSHVVEEIKKWLEELEMFRNLGLISEAEYQEQVWKIRLFLLKIINIL